MDDMNEGILRITNHQDHPTNKFYKVFFYYNVEQADYFQELLEEKKIWYERDFENNKGKEMHLFGIKLTNVREVHRLNYLAIGRFRKPIFDSNYARMGIAAFGILIVLFGIISYFFSPVYQN